MISKGVSCTDLYWMVLVRCGPSLKDLMTAHHRFSLKTSVQIGVQLLDKLQILHEQGFTHQDLKPNNVLLESADFTNPSNIILIDFGFSHEWRNENLQHVEKKKLQKFIGNITFASHNAFKFRSQSRRDDIISLAYLLVYLATGMTSWT